MDINILDYLEEKNVILGINQKNKKNTISFLLDNLIVTKKIKPDSKKDLLKLIMQREDMGSTAIGGHIALPHVRTDQVKDVVICFGVSDSGIEFDSLDQAPVHVVVLLLSNQKQAGLHLKTLALLAKLLKDKYFIQRLRKIEDKDLLLKLISKQQLAVV
ncbi:MAG: PTS sugar transporter subunit IIA [Candidatus Omnitrophica bacterium]|jgi:mannitol/fructose-specific phosphotransferase system IIA component (Ntr-type)|nr:PTS sugar transporter subunit IIA [Candidatus Omnitrophota bacterium]MDD5080820.1 PTS sugar transporter subunit IIA [Candidatus Omnitrophota bacterium]MDD5441235.1 PTS sugar transporter subunit IIA [Candidatus Omnitrophota bacterium]